MFFLLSYALSLILSVYSNMDELINALAKSKVGCYIGSRFYGALCCSDDLTL